MINIHDLEAMSNQSIEAADKAQLKLLSDVRVKKDAPSEEKVLSFIEQIGNPYCFLSGNTPVRVRFAENGKSVNQALENIIQAMRQA